MITNKPSICPGVLEIGPRILRKYYLGSDRNMTGWKYDTPLVSDFRKGFASKLR